MRRLQVLIAAAVAAGCVALAVADGGFEPIVYCAVGIALWAAIASIALFGLWPKDGLGLATLATAAVLVALALLGFASMSWAPDGGRAFAEGARAATYAGLFVLAALAIRACGPRAALAGLAVGLVSVAALGVLARIAPGLIGTEPEVERLAYPIGYWNGLGAAMAGAICLLAWLAVEARADGRGRFALVPLAATALPLAALAMTASRGGFLALVAGLTVLGAALSRHPRKILTAAAVALAVAVTAVVISSGGNESPDGEPELGSAEAQEHVVSGGTSGRSEYWQSALDAFAEEPLHGIGAGEFEQWWTQNGTLGVPATNAHSLPLESLAELGPAGLALVLAIFAIPAIAGVRLLRIARREGAALPAEALPAAAGLALLTTGAVAAGLDWTWELPAVFGLAIVAAAVLTQTPAPPPGGVGIGMPRWSQPLVAVGIAAAAISVCGAQYLGEQRITESQAYAAQGQLEAAAERARAASDVLPFAAEPYTQLALVERSAGNLDAAAAALAEAIERSPKDWRLWLLSSRIAYQQGAPEASVTEDLFRARELAPRAPHQLFVPSRRIEGGAR